MQGTSTQRDLFIYKVSCWYLLRYRYIPDQVQSVKMEQIAIISKLDKTKLQCLWTALLLNEIYLSRKFLVDISCRFIFFVCRHVPDKKFGWKDGPTVCSDYICSCFGEHRKVSCKWPRVLHIIFFSNKITSTRKN